MNLLPVFVLLLLICFCYSDDRLTPSKPLSPGDQLISNDGVFALGFFSLENSNASSYVGIWYHNIPERTYVWVANRDNPINRSLSGKLVLTNTSDLVLSDSKGDRFWNLDYTGDLMFRIWRAVLFERTGDGCRRYGSCGPFGYCNNMASTGECRCFDGFEPADGFSVNFSRGCVRKEALRCSGDNFLTLPGMKVPDKFMYVRNRSFEECTAECDRDCSCTAYAYVNLSSIIATTVDPSRCLIWIGDLVDSEKAGEIGGNL